MEYLIFCTSYQAKILKTKMLITAGFSYTSACICNNDCDDSGPVAIKKKAAQTCRDDSPAHSWFFQALLVFIEKSWRVLFHE